MAHPIFSTWVGSHDDLRAAGIGGYGSRWEAYDVGEFSIVINHCEHPHSRTGLRNLHPNLIVMPGPNGLLKKEHLKHINMKMPQIKEGDAFRTVLSEINQPLGLDVLDPDSY